MNFLKYSIAALISVLLGYLPFYGDIVSEAMFIPTLLSATFAAGASYLLLDSHDWLPQSKSISRTGALRGALVVLLAHFLFGFIFIGWAIVATAENVNVTMSKILSTLQEALSVSAISGIFLPITLLVGCATGIVVEKSRNAVDA